jgi:RimJ/RimL family protein N-acetyltransferase
MNHLSFRKATESDSDLYFEWVNDPLVREQSYNSNYIEKEVHISWFSDKVKDSNFYFYIFQNQNNQNIGQVRIQKINDSNSIIGVSVDSKHRGYGYGSKILELACNDFLLAMPKIIINAYIKKENSSSKIIFEKAGFNFKELVEHQNFKSLHYIKHADRQI